MLSQSELLDITLKYLHTHKHTRALIVYLIGYLVYEIHSLESPPIQPTERMHAEMQFRSFDYCKWPNIQERNRKEIAANIEQSFKIPTMHLFFSDFLFPCSFALFRLCF